MKISIVDYSLGNTKSIVNALTAIGCTVENTNSERELEKADGLILSGVGNFGEGMKKLQKSGLVKILDRLVLREKKPILGICLGLQLMTIRSEESDIPGLGWLPCETKKLPNLAGIKIPNIGWNSVEKNLGDQFAEGIGSNSRLFFTHSYAILDAPKKYVVLESKHGERFVAAIRKDNIYGVQFHPEKSYSDGQRVIRNFVELACGNV
jgi:glutamine amidotransferase